MGWLLVRQIFAGPVNDASQNLGQVSKFQFETVEVTLLVQDHRVELLKLPLLERQLFFQVDDRPTPGGALFWFGKSAHEGSVCLALVSGKGSWRV